MVHTSILLGSQHSMLTSITHTRVIIHSVEVDKAAQSVETVKVVLTAK